MGISCVSPIPRILYFIYYSWVYIIQIRLPAVKKILIKNTRVILPENLKRLPKNVPLFKRASKRTEKVYSRAFLKKKGELAMFRSIGLKSVLIGGLLGVAILCLVGAVPSVRTDEYGRFQIETNNGHAFILDSATGQVWSSRFPSPESGFGVKPDPNFHAPKTKHSNE